MQLYLSSVLVHLRKTVRRTSATVGSLSQSPVTCLKSQCRVTNMNQDRVCPKAKNGRLIVTRYK